jgi:hypothetical protein
MLCEVCNTEEAAFTVIPVGEGMPQTLGPACLARWVLQNCRDVLPAEEIAGLLGPMFVQPPQGQPTEAETPAKGRKRAAKTQAAETPEGPVSGAAETPATASNE